MLEERSPHPFVSRSLREALAGIPLFRGEEFAMTSV